MPRWCKVKLLFSGLGTCRKDANLFIPSIFSAKASCSSSFEVVRTTALNTRSFTLHHFWNRSGRSKDKASQKFEYWAHSSHAFMSIFASKSPQWTMSVRDSSNVGMLLKASTNSCKAFCRGTALLLGFVCFIGFRTNTQRWKRNTSHPASKSRTMAGSSMISDFPSTSTMMAHRSPSRFSAGTGSVRIGVESSQRLCQVSPSVGTWVFSTQSPALPTCSRHVKDTTCNFACNRFAGTKPGGQMKRQVIWILVHSSKNPALYVDLIWSDVVLNLSPC